MTRITRSARPAPTTDVGSIPLEVAVPFMDRVLREDARRNPPTTIVYKEEEEHSEGASKVDYVAVIARYKAKITNRTSAIRAKCVECSGGALSEVRECRITACALHPYRLGEDPRNKKVLDRKAREAAAQDGVEGEDE